MLVLVVAIAVFVAWSWLSYPAVGHWLYDLAMAIEARLYKLHKIEVPIAELGIAPDESYEVSDLLTGARYVWRGARNYVRLDPAQSVGHVFKVSRLA